MKILFLSIICLTLGYIALYFVNDKADNIFSIVSPFLIISGYIIYGIFLYKSE